ncbi:MAG: ABC transporter substrate-binding protein [Pseudomonadota bacterium]
MTLKRLTRRGLLQASGAAATVLASPAIVRAAEPIKMAAILDQSGGLELLGRPMLEATKMAVSEINAAGGLLDRQIELISYDPQTTIQFYTQFATQAAAGDRVDVVHAGITSASREAIRPVLNRFQTLYFYNTLYEGGVCDYNNFCTGSTPAQTVEKLVPYAMNKWGKKVYIIAADYNYGHITADWVQKYVRDNGGENVAVEFFPLDVTNFGPTIKKIQTEKPDFVMSALVGAAHISFYRQYGAAGVNKEIPLASTTFTLGGEHKLVSAEEGNGMIVSFAYFEEIDTPANKKFVEDLRAFSSQDIAYISETTARSYEGVYLWAEGVKKAGTTDRAAVIEALRSPVAFDGPSGTVTIEPKTNHLVQNVAIAELQDQTLNVLETFEAQPPADTLLVCDLDANPDQSTFYFENGLAAAGID